MALNARQAALSALHGARAIAPSLGFHDVRVVVRTRTWSSGRVQTGVPTVADLAVGAPDPASGAILPPHVEGTSGDVEITVGPVTPFDPVAAPRGYTAAQLNPSAAAGVEYYYLVTFPDGVSRAFVLTPRGMDTSRPLRVMLKLRALDRAVPF
jgi:hypothetical protein